MCACKISAQTLISGVVTDDRGPLVGANVFIVGTIDGALSDSTGHFSFHTDKTGEMTLRASFIGYEDFTLTATSLSSINIRMHERPTSIDEVVVAASNYSFGKSDNFKTMDALDVVLAGNSCGDIVAALQTLPGTQKVGEDNKLYVRGGESDECQTFVNGMHVLEPYTANVNNNGSRGRFSPFLFKGINFSLGGYNGEYGQALSAVLPMETKDVAESDKLGVSASLVDWNAGGTKSFENSSLSFNADYTSLGLYNAIFPDRCSWTRPYGKLSGEAQYKAELSQTSVAKAYVGYDFTTVGQQIDERVLSLNEHNIYANATFKSNIGKGCNIFMGIANSSIISNIDDALTAGDHYHNRRNEIHIKAELRKLFSPALKMSVGAEEYIRNSTKRYDQSCYEFQYNLTAAHIDAQIRIAPKLFLTLATRAENTSYDHRWLLMPRTTLSFVHSKQFQISAMIGRYSQTADDDYIAQSDCRLSQSTANHAIISLQYSHNKTLLRIEPYYKKYSRLPLLVDNTYENNGYGTSHGIDFFAENHSLTENLITTLSYSFNQSKRLYIDYDAPRTPSYASRHNVRMTAKYSLGKIILGLADSFATGRQTATRTTPNYNSLDANITVLVNPKIIVYSSISNILGRTNIYGYDTDNAPITSTRDRFFYIGIFVSLINNKAYDISNF